LTDFINKAKAKWERTAHEADELEINKYEQQTYKALQNTANGSHNNKRNSKDA
jgi:hypothetical protein